jgi:hypothetical protein
MHKTSMPSKSWSRRLCETVLGKQTKKNVIQFKGVNTFEDNLLGVKLTMLILCK